MPLAPRVYSPEGLALDPAGATAIHPSPGLAGSRLLALDNGKRGADVLLARLGEQLAARAGARFGGVLRKGTAATPCEPELLDRLAAEGDLVLTGTLD